VDESRSHYEVVGKSRLRKSQAVSLGPQYSGSRISRKAVEDDDEDDPFSRGFDDEESDEEDSGNDSEDVEEVNGSGDEEGGSQSQSDQEEGTGANGYRPSTDGIDRAEIRKLMADDHKTVAANLSQSARADAEKGHAVKKQRAAFDALLSLRIKLQKALVAVNSIPLAEQEEITINSDQDAMRKAETAAITLFNNLTSLRSSLDSARSGQKRKYSGLSPSADLSSTWDSTNSLESSSLTHRNSTLDFWSTKCRATTAVQTRKLTTQNERSLTDVLNSHLSDLSRLVSRTRLPRSCAPLQAAKLSQPRQEASEADLSSLPIYDDADFYTLLLQTLISQRSDDTSALPISMEPWQAAREAKVRKVVDTRASKGRKLRYTVHEKLQNFMAPEDRSSWGERQCDELFGSLFGRSVGLGEGDEEEDDGEGLRLFAGV
jgi:protein AATF/BFR2